MDDTSPTNPNIAGVRSVVDDAFYAASKSAELLDRHADSHLRRVEQTSLMLGSNAALDIAKAVAANPTS